MLAPGGLSAFVLWTVPVALLPYLKMGHPSVPGAAALPKMACFQSSLCLVAGFESQWRVMNVGQALAQLLGRPSVLIQGASVSPPSCPSGTSCPGEPIAPVAYNTVPCDSADLKGKTGAEKTGGESTLLGQVP